MIKILYVEINALAIIILVLIYLNIYKKTDKYMTEQKLFNYMLISNISILIFDTLMWVLDGINTPLMHLALKASTLIYFLIQPIICMLWSIYVDYQINKNNDRFKKLLLPMLIPISINTVLSFISLYYRVFYYIDNNNVYHRGNFFSVLPVISFTYILYTFAYLLRSRKRITVTYFRSLLAFIFWPISGAIIQFFFYGVTLIWIGMTVSIFTVFINIQNQQMYNDYLTGLYNRRQLDLYLQDFRSKSKSKIAGILLDINSFKSINDQYGHSVGDEALKYTAYLLKKTFRHNSFISRLGGDEFVILLELNDPSDLEKSIKRLRKNVIQFNHLKGLPYQLDFSIGADIYAQESKLSGQEFLDHIDKLMYLDKRQQNITIN